MVIQEADTAKKIALTKFHAWHNHEYYRRVSREHKDVVTSKIS